MARGAQPQAEHHRDIAAQFRTLADIEPSGSLRQRLQRLAKRHDGLAADLEAHKADDKSAP